MEHHPELHAVSAHVLVKGQEVKQLDTIRQGIEVMLKQKYNITHTTLQMECKGCGDEGPQCQLCVKPDDEHEHEHDEE